MSEVFDEWDELNADFKELEVSCPQKEYFRLHSILLFVGSKPDVFKALGGTKQPPKEMSGAYTASTISNRSHIKEINQVNLNLLVSFKLMNVVGLVD